MPRRLIDRDPLTGIATYHHYDPGTDVTHIEEVQDVQGILEHTKRLANDGDYKRKGIKEDWYHFATVPNTVLMEILTKHRLDWRRSEDLPKIERLLQSEYKKLLTVNRI